MELITASNYDLGKSGSIPYDMNNFEAEVYDKIEYVYDDVEDDVEDDEPVVRRELWGKVKYLGNEYAVQWLPDRQIWYVFYPFWKYPRELEEWFVSGTPAPEGL